MTRAALGALLAAACLANCTEPATVRMAASTPERQFVLGDVRIEERRGNRVLWLGHARRADGDLSMVDAEDIVLTRQPQKDGQTAFTIRAPRGHLAFDDGLATFEGAKLSDPSGRQLDAGRAHYNEQAQEILAEGPLTFYAAGLITRAARARVDLRTNAVRIEGPVHGRYVPPAGEAELARARRR